MINRFVVGILLGVFLFALPAFAAIPDDPHYDDQWYLDLIDAPSAWDVSTGSSDIVVAVLDSGLDFDHPDLEDAIWRNAGEIAGDGVDNDRNGYVDDLNGWDFVEGDETPEPDEGESHNPDAVIHGTAISGVIGALGDNAEGIAGIAWNVRLMPLRILDNFGSGNSEDARQAVRYAMNNGADVINLSFTGFEIDSAFSSAVRDAYEAGIVVVAAVGNADGGGVDLNDQPVYPACFRGGGNDWVIGVAATDEDDLKTDFSNFGSSCVDLSAPGEDIFSTSYENPDWDDFEELYLGGWSGTSIASPMVAGASALLLSAYPTLTPDDVRVILQLSVDPLSTDSDLSEEMGAGRLNVGRAMEIGAQFSGTSEPPPPESVDGLVEPPPDTETGVTRDRSGNRVAPASGAIGLSPKTGFAESISAVHAGWFIRAAGYDTVYYLDSELNRHPFWDAKTFFTYADSWDEIVWVTDATLPTLPLAKPLTPKPGVVLVKIQSDASVYAVEWGTTGTPVLRRISSETVAGQMFGAGWAEFVIDIEPTLFPLYDSGEDITTVEPVDLTIMRTRAEIDALIAGSGT